MLDLLDFVVPLVVLAVAIYLARLDAKERRQPPMIWPQWPPDGPIDPRPPPKIRVLEPPSIPDDADTVVPTPSDAQTLALSAEDLEAFHERLAERRRLAPSSDVGEDPRRE